MGHVEVSPVRKFEGQLSFRSSPEWPSSIGTLRLPLASVDSDVTLPYPLNTSCMDAFLGPQISHDPLLRIQ
jgi:hypothetical protein